MNRIRRDTQDSTGATIYRPLRIVASGTLFVTTSLGLPTHPEPNSAVRAHSVSRVRGGSASTCLSIIAQFPSVEASLVAPLGGNEEGRTIIKELEAEGVRTRYCKIWPEAGVPSAWVLHADDSDSRTVINNNPVPDITHEEFISLTGPLLVPENYTYLNSPANPAQPGSQQLSASNAPGSSAPRTSMSAPGPNPANNSRTVSNSPAPIDWIHFEGRSVKTTLSNLMGLDGLVRERKWRSHCVFSVDVGRRARQGVEALIPHADVLFLNKHYARAHSPQYASSPRAFLLSLTTLAPPHALLVAHWGEDGAAVLSVPTREYFQSSGWAEPTVPDARNPAHAAQMQHQQQRRDQEETDVRSVRTGSDFWAGGHETESSSMFTADLLQGPPPSRERDRKRKQKKTRAAPRRGGGGASSDSDSDDSDGTQIAGEGGGGRRPGLPAATAAGRGRGGQAQTSEIVDEVGAQDAFVAGMMWALTRRLLPGEPYTPSAVPRDAERGGVEGEQKGRWRLEECLRFATELAGRKARRRGWNGLADEMAAAGWFQLFTNP